MTHGDTYEHENNKVFLYQRVAYKKRDKNGLVFSNLCSA